MRFSRRKWETIRWVSSGVDPESVPVKKSCESRLLSRLNFRVLGPFLGLDSRGVTFLKRSTDFSFSSDIFPNLNSLTIDPRHPECLLKSGFY